MAYISEVFYNGNTSSDFVEVAVPAGTDVSSWTLQVYNNGGNLQASTSLGAPVATENSMNIYVLDSIGNLNKNNAVALVDDTGTVTQFVSFEGNTVTARNGAADDLTSSDVGTAQSGESLQTNDAGATYTSGAPSPGVTPCFATGTRILTPGGWCPVEDIKAGDLIQTLDQGAQPVLWTQSDHQIIDPSEDQWPIRIEMDAFGPGAPVEDLVLSGQHRVLLGAGSVLPDVFAQEYLAPAKALVALPRVRHMRETLRITWHHFALRRHAVCFAEGLAVESLYLGPVLLAGLPAWERHALHGIFGAVDEDGALNGPKARPFLSVVQVQRVLTKAAKTAA